MLPCNLQIGYDVITELIEYVTLLFTDSWDVTPELIRVELKLVTLQFHHLLGGHTPWRRKYKSVYGITLDTLRTKQKQISNFHNIVPAFKKIEYLSSFSFYGNKTIA